MRIVVSPRVPENFLGDMLYTQDVPDEPECELNGSNFLRSREGERVIGLPEISTDGFHPCSLPQCLQQSMLRSRRTTESDLRCETASW